MINIELILAIGLPLALFGVVWWLEYEAEKPMYYGMFYSREEIESWEEVKNGKSSI